MNGWQKMREEVLKKRYLRNNETEKDMYKRTAEFIMESEWKPYYELMCRGDFLPNTPTLVNAGYDAGTLSACFVLPLEDSLDGIMNTLTRAAKVHKMFGGTGFDFSVLRPAGSIISSTGGQASGPCGFIKLFDAMADVVRQGGRREGANMGILSCEHPDIYQWIKMKNQEDTLKHFNISVAICDRCMRENEKLLDAIAYNAWLNGEPGVVFIDEVNRKHTCSHLGRITATNPCGEQPLLPNESCNLGSINLANMIKNGGIDWSKLEDTVDLAVRFLDRVIDKNKFPDEEIESATKRTRKIGLGIMGFHDMLIKLNVRYASSQALEIAESIMKFIRDKAIETSMELATDFGVFPAWNGSYWDKVGVKIRNATLTTIAPTGSLSILANCSPGIEPWWAVKFKRTTEYGTYDVVVPIAEEYDINETAMNVPVEYHVRIQAAFQKYTDNAVSKTINLPNHATVDDVKKAIKLAWQLGCKGITVYRLGSRKQEVVNTSTDRPDVLYGRTYKAYSGCGKLYVTINDMNNKPFEVFVKTAGGCEANNEAIGRMISLALRSNIPVDQIIKQLKKVKCVNAMRSEKSIGNSCAHVIGVLLEQTTKGGGEKHKNLCPQCGCELHFAEGCMNGSCPSCGWSGCV